jgi:hypothetical protein
MKRTTALLAFFLAALLSVHAFEDWKLFSSERGRFTALFPGTPTEQKNPVDTALGKIDMYQYSTTQGGAVYMISFNDLPVAQTGKMDLLDTAVKSAQQSLGGNVQDDTKIPLDGYAGRSWRSETPTLTLMAKYLWVRPRMYQLLVAAPKGTLNFSEARRFLDSFKLLGTGGSTPPPAPEPAAPTNGVLKITSQPGSVEVYLDDKRRGTTSAEQGKLVLDDLAPGSYKLRLSLAGYKDWAQSVTLTAGQSAEIQAEMKVAGPGAFTLQDVVDMLRGEIPTKRVATLVQQRGVDFALTDEIEKRIRDAGGDSDLLLAIAKARK